MIITRAPLRITLGGGGTDLPSYYREHGGFLIAAAIDRYVYIALHKTFVADLFIRYTKLERVTRVEEVEHPIIREALKIVGIEPRYLELTSMADIPAGTGLGSSGSFATALLTALHTYKRNFIHPAQLAEQACHIEIDLLREPTGKQDQYISAFGGITCFRFLRDGSVETAPLRISEETRYNLEDNLLLFFTRYSRSASRLLKDQDDKSRASDPAMNENLHFVKKIAMQSQQVLESGDLNEFGRLMNIHWEYKKKRSDAMTSEEIDRWYEHGLANGAIGGKLVGAGGGGFLMFYASEKAKLRHEMRLLGLTEVRFGFDLEGTKVLIQ